MDNCLVYVVTGTPRRENPLPPLVKIGITNQFRMRMKDLRSTASNPFGEPIGIEAIATWICQSRGEAVLLESKLHHRFRDSRKVGEWFDLSSGDIESMEGLDVSSLEEPSAEYFGMRSKATFDLPSDLLREMRVLSFEVPPRAIGGSLSGLVEKSVRAEVEKLRAKFNAGKPFESDKPPQVRKGRPPRGDR